MALNIKNAEVERLAEEVAGLAGETKTEAIRRDLEERRGRLVQRIAKRTGDASLRRFLEREIWPLVPRGARRPANDETRAGGDPGIRRGGRVIIDSSAVVAIFLKEPGHEEVLHKLGATESRAIGAPTVAETGIVLTSRMRRNAIGLLARFLQEVEVATVPFSDDHWKEAVDAFDRFGRGRHEASLSFGDCMT